MITFRGNYFDGRSSQAHPVTVTCAMGIVRVHADTGTIERLEPLAALTITPPLGQAHRTLQFPDGASCETGDLTAMAALDAQHRPTWGVRLVHTLESHWRFVVSCLAGLLLSLWLFAAYGIPWLAKYTAYATPLHLLARVSERSMALLDQTLFEPSELSAERLSRLQQQFAEVTRSMGTHGYYQLVVRRSQKIGANAFALPSGLIIITDELIVLAQDEREILAVLAHEVGHVELRHSLRNIYQSAGIFLLLAVLAGDVTSINSAAASVPTLLIEMGYSRKFEYEADARAATYTLEQGWGTKPLRMLLHRLANAGASVVPTFLSTHPGTAERLKYLERLERSWSQAQPRH